MIPGSNMISPGFFNVLLFTEDQLVQLKNDNKEDMSKTKTHPHHHVSRPRLSKVYVRQF